MSERTPVPAQDRGVAALLLQHLDSAYNLARWLVRNGDDAEDVVQEAFMRALQYSSGFRGGDARAWLLTIVRNTSFGWLRRARTYEPATEFDENIHSSSVETSNPEEQLLRNADGHLVAQALGQLPVRFREILVLRELEGLSYKEIAGVLGVPIGTVMSTLSRARHRFRQAAGALLNVHTSSESSAVPRPSSVSVPEYSGAPGD